jgi:hypothetical protein
MEIIKEKTGVGKEGNRFIPDASLERKVKRKEFSLFPKTSFRTFGDSSHGATP